MTATLATLRPAPHPTEPRQRLAAAIDRLAAVQARVARVAAAEVKAAALSHDKFREIEAAEKAIAEARQVEPHRLVSRLLGDEPDAPALADVARELNDAKSAREALAGMRETLATEHREADFSLGLARQNRDAAAAAVLRASPGVAALLAEFDEVMHRYATLRAALRWLATLPRDALTDSQRGRLDLHVDGWPADPAAVIPPWQAAIEALQSDAAALLPGDDPTTPKEAA